MDYKQNGFCKSPGASSIFARTIIFSVLLVIAGIGIVTSALAETKITKTIEGVEATLTLSPSPSLMVLDLILVDAETGKAITGASVTALIVNEDGHVTRKELMGMKMGEVYSYMNSVDKLPKGFYEFHIVIEIGKKTLHFHANSDVN